MGTATAGSTTIVTAVESTSDLENTKGTCGDQRATDHR